MELLRTSGYYRTDFLNPLLTEERLDYLLYTPTFTDSYASILHELVTDLHIHAGTQVENQGSCALEQLGGYDLKNNRKKALEFLLMGSVNVRGLNAFPIETTPGLFSTGEKHNDLLNSSSKVNYQDLYQLWSILAAKCKRELADAGNRIPNQDRNRGNIYQAQNGNGNGNAAYNGEAQAANNGQNEVDHIGAVNVAGGDDDDGGFDANNDENQTMVIYRYVFNGRNIRITLEERIQTNVIANNCQNWNDLAVNILEVWRQRNTGCIPPIYGRVRPENCWPGAETIFGQRSNGVFQSTKWRTSNFGQVKMYLNCLLVIENVNGFAENGMTNYQTQNQGGIIETVIYDFRHEEMEIHFTEAHGVLSKMPPHQSWLELAREMYCAYTMLTGIGHDDDYAYDNIHAANCWPGADTIFGNWNNGRFKSFNWPNYAWEHVRQWLNCLLVIRYE